VIDFWTYSCVNCLRTLPYLKRWDAAYRRDGLTIVGVHAPEFAFEREPSNVRHAVGELGVRYPVAQDNEFITWRRFSNQYWPAKYVIDRRGHVRYAHFGEGEYAATENVIRRLLAEGGRTVAAAPTVDGTDEAAYGRITPETYVGYSRLDRYAGSPLVEDRPAAYRFPAAMLPLDHLALAGGWRVEGERAVARGDARLRLRFRAREVNLVLGGMGRVDVLLDGMRRRSVAVDEDRLYRLLELPADRDGTLELRLTPGVEAYAFTFG
jgi:thiol-disulfide isomerase/thioredoxin